MMVNIGGFAGPFVAAAIRNEGWNYVFIASSIWIALNIPILLLFYKEPTKEAGTAGARSFKQVMVEMMEVLGNGRFFVTIFVLLTILVMGQKWLSTGEMLGYAGIWIALNILFDIFLKFMGTEKGKMKVGNVRFLLFLLLLSSFWVAFNQVFLTLPEYIRDFTDTKTFMDSILASLGAMGFGEGFIDKVQYIFAKADGSIKPEHFIGINALCIIFFQILVSYAMAKMKPLYTIMIGIGITAVSFAFFILGMNPIFVILGVAVFSFGEMMASPKAKEYTAMAVAPPEKVGLYMGYYLWCNALGNLFGGLLSGKLYGWLARDLGRPDIMWIIFGLLSLVCVGLLYIYHRTVGVKIEKENLETA